MVTYRIYNKFKSHILRTNRLDIANIRELLKYEKTIYVFVDGKDYFIKMERFDYDSNKD